jgi:hypothetical protein
MPAEDTPSTSGVLRGNPEVDWPEREAEERKQMSGRKKIDNKGFILAEYVELIK